LYSVLRKIQECTDASLTSEQRFEAKTFDCDHQNTPHLMGMAWIVVVPAQTQTRHHVATATSAMLL
jgi:hypothetical protein